MERRKGNVEVGKDLEVDGNAKVNGTLEVDGDATLNYVFTSRIANKDQTRIIALRATDRASNDTNNQVELTLNAKQPGIGYVISTEKTEGEIETKHGYLEPWNYSEAKYLHTITFTIVRQTSGEYALISLQAYLSSAEPIDSEADLQTYLGGGLFSTSGHLVSNITPNSKPGYCISLDTHATSWMDYLLAVLSDDGLHIERFKLSEIWTLTSVGVTITDDVSIPK